jgi:hypothetical protein
VQVQRQRLLAAVGTPLGGLCEGGGPVGFERVDGLRLEPRDGPVGPREVEEAAGERFFEVEDGCGPRSWSVATGKNPKTEARNPKEIRNGNVEAQNTKRGFWILSFPL